jgi:hypothetical protein
MKALIGWRRQHGAGLPAPATHEHLVQRADRLFWCWAAMMGLMAFVAWWLRERGAWLELVNGDPSGISVATIVMSLIVGVWCGLRMRLLGQQAAPASAWRRQYQQDMRVAGSEAALQSLAERTHGPHETAWWFASAAIKLGLLGTVVGFIAMSLQIGRMANFDFDQIQTLLKRMTEGMAIALYTTLVGLIANLWLGFMLMLLDRQADALAADVLARGSGPGAGSTAATPSQEQP